MGRLGLALGYIITGDTRLLDAYDQSLPPRRSVMPIQPPPSKEWLAFIKQLELAGSEPQLAHTKAQPNEKRKK